MSDPIPSSPVSPDPWKDVCEIEISDSAGGGFYYRAAAVDAARAADDARHQQEMAAERRAHRQTHELIGGLEYQLATLRAALSPVEPAPEGRPTTLDLRLRPARETVGGLGTDGPLDAAPRFELAGVSKCDCGLVEGVHDLTCPMFDRPVASEPPADLRDIRAKHAEDMRATSGVHQDRKRQHAVSSLTVAQVDRLLSREPAPCVWREVEDGDGKWRRTVMRTGCGLREDVDEMRPLSEWPFCAQCGSPLKVER